MNLATWQRLQRVIFRAPERLDALHLLFVDHAEQPHFAVDPAWPPRSDFADSRYVHSHHPSAEELAAEEERERSEWLYKAREYRKREALKGLVERLEAEDQRELQRLKRQRGWHKRRGVFTVRCPVCHAARFQKCTGTFHRAAHLERHALAWPD